jgi:hypothetical protein
MAWYTCNLPRMPAESIRSAHTATLVASTLLKSKHASGGLQRMMRGCFPVFRLRQATGQSGGFEAAVARSFHM